MKKIVSTDENLAIAIAKSQARFERIKNPKGADAGVGHFLLILEVTAKERLAFLPLSISSGKKTTGFIYQIEGTGAGALSTASVEVRGTGVTQVTLGTLEYAKIEVGKTATFRLQIEMKGKIGKEYSVLVHQINYKLAATDARYKKYQGSVASKKISFR